MPKPDETQALIAVLRGEHEQEHDAGWCQQYGCPALDAAEALERDHAIVERVRALLEKRRKNLVVLWFDELTEILAKGVPVEPVQPTMQCGEPVYLRGTNEMLYYCARLGRGHDGPHSNNSSYDDAPKRESPPQTLEPTASAIAHPDARDRAIEALYQIAANGGTWERCEAAVDAILAAAQPR